MTDDEDDQVTPEKDPLAQLLDVCVYAPLGFVLDAPKLLPGLAERVAPRSVSPA